MDVVIMLVVLTSHLPKLVQTCFVIRFFSEAVFFLFQYHPVTVCKRRDTEAPFRIPTIMCSCIILLDELMMTMTDNDQRLFVMRMCTCGLVCSRCEWYIHPLDEY